MKFLLRLACWILKLVVLVSVVAWWNPPTAWLHAHVDAAVAADPPPSIWMQYQPCPAWAQTLGRWPTTPSSAGSYHASGTTGHMLAVKPHRWSLSLSWSGAEWICSSAPIPQVLQS